MANKILVEFSSRGADQLKKKVDDLYISQVRLQKGHKAATAALKKLNTETAKNTKVGALSTKTTRIQTGAFATLRSKLLLASFAFSIVSATVLRLGKQFGEQEQAEKRLEHVIGKSSASLKAKASALQEVTRFGDEETLAAMTLVGAYTTNEQAIASLTEAAQDLATVKGMDLKTATDMLSKSVFSSTNSMQRYGIIIEGTAGTSDRLNSALKAVSTQMGGAAIQDAETFLGSLDQMNNAIGDVGETLGAALAPSITMVAKAIKSFSESLDAEHVEKFLSVISGAGIVWLGYTLATRLATTATKLFTATTRKNIALLAAMLIVGKIIDHMDLFAASTEELDDEIKKLNEELENGLGVAKSQTEIDREAFEARRKLGMGVAELNFQIDKGIAIRKDGLLLDMEEMDLLHQKAIVIQDIKAFEDKKLQGLLTEQERKEYDLLLQKKHIEQQKIENALDLKAVKDREASSKKMIQISGQTAKAFLKDSDALKIVDFQLMMINAYKTASNTYALLSKTMPPPLPGIFAGIEFAGAAALAAQAQQYQYGGLVGGQRHSQGGTMIEAEQGEFVMSRDAVDSIGINNLETMNAGGGGINVNISGNVMSADFVENELAEKVQEAVRKGIDFGIS